MYFEPIPININIMRTLWHLIRIPSHSPQRKSKKPLKPVQNALYPEGKTDEEKKKNVLLVLNLIQYQFAEQLPTMHAV